MEESSNPPQTHPTYKYYCFFSAFIMGVYDTSCDVTHTKLFRLTAFVKFVYYPL